MPRLAVFVGTLFAVIAVLGVFRLSALIVAAAACGMAASFWLGRGTARLLAAVAALQGRQESLHEAGSRIRDGARVVGAASADIAQGNGELARRTAEHASSIGQVTASVEQLAGSVRKNADNARAASALAAKSAEAAENGSRIVERAVETMDAMRAESARMADIVGLIDGIAFQTNLLALNAAVEAARAGEHGRGFAVVASEVRALAQRSANAAKEIKTMIAAGVEQTAAGARLASDAGFAITGILAMAEEVALLIAAILRGSQEQHAGIGQIGKALAHMELGTQRNAALVEQTHAATQALLQQARELAAQVPAETALAGR